MTPEQMYNENLLGKSYRKIAREAKCSHQTVFRHIKMVRQSDFKGTSFKRSLLADYPQHREWILNHVSDFEEGKFYSNKQMQNYTKGILPLDERLL